VPEFGVVVIVMSWVETLVLIEVAVVTLVVVTVRLAAGPAIA